MPLIQQLSVYSSTILLWTGLAMGADLASAMRAYDEKDYGTALKELTPLAQQGDPEAELFLGKMYMKGEGVLKDPDQARKWFEASGNQGNADAQLFLGSMYVLTRKNMVEGMKWLRLSAEQGNQDAQLLLGKSYVEGSPEVPRDPVLGDMWLRLAAKGNLPFYENQLAAAERQMRQDQITKGKALAEAWKPKPGLKGGDKVSQE